MLSTAKCLLMSLTNVFLGLCSICRLAKPAFAFAGILFAFAGILACPQLCSSQQHILLSKRLELLVSNIVFSFNSVSSQNSIFPYASVTFAFRRVYDEYTMPIRCPNHSFRAASAGRPCNNRTDLPASLPLRFYLTHHNDKFEKNVSP